MVDDREERHPLWFHTLHTNGVALASAIPAILLMSAIMGLLEWVRENTEVNEAEVAVPFVVILFEASNMIMVGRGKTVFQACRRKMCLFPTFIALSSIGFFYFDGSPGYYTMPLSALCYVPAIASTHIIMDGGVESYKKEFILCVLISVLLHVCAYVPGFCTILPVQFLAESYPEVNIVVSGVAFPSVMYFIRKTAFNFMLDYLEKKVKKGKMTAEQMLKIAPQFLLVASIALLAVTIAVQFIAKSVTFCVLTSLVSVITELGGKIYLMLFLRKKREVLVALKKKKEDANSRILDARRDGIGENEAPPRLCVVDETVTSEAPPSISSSRVSPSDSSIKSKSLSTSSFSSHVSSMFSAITSKKEGEKSNAELEAEAAKAREEMELLESEYELMKARLALKWNAEMIAEKSCIWVAPFMVHFTMPVEDRTLTEEIQVLAAFVFCEFFADTGVVKYLD